jgi:hypothetical protein
VLHARAVMRILPSAIVVLLVASGCGSVAESPRVALGEKKPEDAASTSTALIIATRDGAASVVRVDAENATIAPLTPPLPSGFRPGSFHASPARDRFVVSGEENGKGKVYAGTRDEWHVLAELEDRWSIAKTSPSLRLVALAGHDEVGRPIGARVVRFDGTLVSDLGASHDPVHVDDEAFIAVEYELERVDGDAFVRVGHEKQPWWVYDAIGERRVRLADDRGPYEYVFGVDGGFAILKEGTCATFRWSDPAAQSATYPCEDVASPLVFAGGSAYRAKVDGRDLVAQLPELNGAAVAELDPAGVSVLVDLRDSDSTQIITFVAASGARITNEPAEDVRDLGASWTRVTSRDGFACAVASRTGCENGWTGTCKKNLVDIVCSDAKTQKSRRVERTYDEDLNLASGGEQFVVTDDAKFVLWVESGVMHRLDGRTFEETVLESPSSFGPREGELPSVFNRRIRY